MNKIELFTIGFTKKSAEKFFTLLDSAGVRRIVDVRLNNVSQLAGFAKRDDLRYLLKTICRIDYTHLPNLAPNKVLLDEYKNKKGEWSVYEKQFLKLMAERNIGEKMHGKIADRDCLLCSEHDPAHCHRRLVAEYLNAQWGNMEITHIL